MDLLEGLAQHNLAIEISLAVAVPSPVPFTFAGMRRGMLRSVPLLPGLVVYGAAFGILAREANLTTMQAALMSAVVFSGSAQMASLLLITSGAGLLALMATICVVNTRYLLFGAALRPWLGGLAPAKAYGSLFFMGDGNWVFTMQAYDEGERDAGYLFGAGSIMFVPWVGGTILGSALGALFANPARLGLDFLLVAFSAALAAGMYKGRSDLWIMAAAAASALMMNALYPSGWTTAIAGIAGGVIAYARYDADR